MVHVPEPAGTGTDPTMSIVGAKGWLAGWRLSARRRSGSECTKSFITEFSLKLDPPQASLRPWHGNRRRSASTGAEPLGVFLLITPE